MTPEQQSRLMAFRQRAVHKNPPLTQDEMLEIVMILRQDRKSAAIASEGARKKAAKASTPIIDGDDLLNEMMG